MKIMKKLAAFALALSLALPMYSVVSYAADGKVSFTDPDTKTGETVEVTCALRAGGENLKSFDITLEYDPEYLAFDSGDSGVTKESNGVLKYSGTGTGNRIGFNMKFTALKVGSTKIEVKEATGVTAGGETVDCTNGNSTVEIAQGTKEVEVSSTGAEDVPVTVDGVSYNLSDNFKNADIPSGFKEVTLSYEGTERRFVQDSNGKTTLGYLVNEQGEGDFFLYNETDSTFSAYVMVTVSPSTTIVLQKEEKGLKIPDGYQEVKLTVNDHEFPAWQNVNEEGFYLVYAMNSNTGEKGFYQYDTTEESYQRFAGSTSDATGEKDTAQTNKILKMVEDNLMFVLIGVAVILLLLFVIIIILAVKLRHRNLELDDLYENGAGEIDEMDGLDAFDELPVDYDSGKSKNRFKKSKDQDNFEDDFEDEDDLESLRIVDDEYDSDMYEDDDDYYDNNYYDDEDDFDDEFDDDYDFDEDEDEDDDDYDVNFIDLD